MAAGGVNRMEAITKGLRMVDENFGYSKFLAGGRPLWSTRTMAERGEIAKLIAWYGR